MPDVEVVEQQSARPRSLQPYAKSCAQAVATTVDRVKRTFLMALFIITRLRRATGAREVVRMEVCMVERYGKYGTIRVWVLETRK